LNQAGRTRWQSPSVRPSARRNLTASLITSDDRGALAGQRHRQHDIVVAVATRWWIERVWRDERERLNEQLKGGPHINDALAELPLENFAEFVQQWLRRNDDMLAEAVFQKVRRRCHGR
jgi:hypothetical protein